MCSTCDCDKKPLVQDKLVFEPKLCRRCGSESYIVLDKVHHECRKCFLESCNRKIRSTIGRSKMMKNNDPILIAYSGGPSSAALLDLIKKSMECDARREQKFRPSIIHIDIQSIFKMTTESQRSERAEQLKTLLDSIKYQYPDWSIYWSTLEMEFAKSGKQNIYSCYESNNLSDTRHNHLLSNLEAQEELHSQLTKECDLSIQHQLVQDLTAELINKIASSINSSISDPSDRVKFVFTGGSATQLANNLMIDVILGKGSTIRSTVSVCDQRPHVPILRPMRDFSKKEVSFYLRAGGVVYHIRPNLVTFADRNACIQTATEAFLSKLYVDYPSTYNTLLRTGNKMQ